MSRLIIPGVLLATYGRAAGSAEGALATLPPEISHELHLAVTLLRDLGALSF